MSQRFLRKTSILESYGLSLSMKAHSMEQYTNTARPENKPTGSKVITLNIQRKPISTDSLQSSWIAHFIPLRAP